VKTTWCRVNSDVRRAEQGKSWLLRALYLPCTNVWTETIAVRCQQYLSTVVAQCADNLVYSEFLTFEEQIKGKVGFLELFT